MTYSPSPQLGARAAGGIASQTARLSATPPFPPVISKRHKRKTIIAERLNEINAYFTQNRETVYRTQMHALQVDMNYVNNAKLYENKPLEAIEDEAESLARTGPRSARAVDVEASLRTGKWAAYFVQDVNDAFEEKDIQLTLVVVCIPSRS